MDAGDVVGQGNRGGAEVGAVHGVPPGALLADLGRLVFVVVHRRRAAMDDQLVVLHPPQQFVDQHERQLHLVGDVAAGRVAPGEKVLQDQGLDAAFGQVGLAERRRLQRHERVGQMLGVVLLGGIARTRRSARFGRRPGRGADRASLRASPPCRPAAGRLDGAASSWSGSAAATDAHGSEPSAARSPPASRESRSLSNGIGHGVIVRSESTADVPAWRRSRTETLRPAIGRVKRSRHDVRSGARPSIRRVAQAG